MGIPQKTFESQSAAAAAGWIPAACLAFSLAALGWGCDGREADEARENLASLSVEIRELELDSLTAKVDPAKLNLARKMASPERSISDIHEKFERSLDAFEEWNREIEEEISDRRRMVESMKRIDLEGFAGAEEAWRRYWDLAAETSMVQGLQWRFR